MDCTVKQLKCAVGGLGPVRSILSEPENSSGWMECSGTEECKAPYSLLFHTIHFIALVFWSNDQLRLVLDHFIFRYFNGTVKCYMTQISDAKG